MKKISYILAVVALFCLASTAFAAKPGAHFTDWNLSGAVMPVPPYGSADISGSDTASKLIVNQPNGAVAAQLTGDMAGLSPNTTYTVYVSRTYTPYVAGGWTLNGHYTFDFEYNGIHYPHDVDISGQSGGTFNISGGYPVGGPHVYEWSGTGTLSGSSITVSADYTLGAPSTHMDMTGTIAPDGSLGGGWSDNYGGPRASTWATTSGHATSTGTGSTGWPGLWMNPLQPFTFTTDSAGAGDWHVNLRRDQVSLPSDLSVWINAAGKTILVSDVIHLY